MYKMCIDRSSDCGGCKISIEIVVRYSGDNRNVAYKMCIHRSSNGTGCKFSIKVGVSYSSDMRNGV